MSTTLFIVAVSFNAGYAMSSKLISMIGLRGRISGSLARAEGSERMSGENLTKCPVSAKVRVDAFVSLAESVFQRREGREGRKSDDFRHCRSTVSYYFRGAYIHVAESLIRVLICLVCFQGDRRIGMLSEWELSRMRVRVHRPTSARCNMY